MFDVFHNVFGKKKYSEPEKATEAEEFEIIDNSASGSSSRNSIQSNDIPPPYLNASPYLQLASNSKAQMQKSNSESSNVNTLTIQDVPFSINSSLKVDQSVSRISHGLDACLAAVCQPACLQMEYDFSLERSVLAGET